MKTKSKTKMKYKNIKWVLRKQIKSNTRTLWTWEKNNFTCIYKNYPTDARIYTPQQLLDKIEEDIKNEGKETPTPAVAETVS